MKSRGAGGDARHTLPMCTRHHRQQHSLGVLTFEDRYGLNLQRLAEFYEAAWNEALWQRMKGASE